MTEAQLREAILRALATVAPELDPTRLDPERTFRDQGEIDSIDFLNFVIAVEAATGLVIPDADQLRLSSLAGALAYLMPKLANRERGAA